MEAQYFKNIDSVTIDEIIKTLLGVKNNDYIEKSLHQIDVDNHSVCDKTKRLDKTIESDHGTTVVPVARIPLALQKLIVSRSASFVAGGKIDLKCNPINDNQQALLDMLVKTWLDNKLDYKGIEITKIMMSETECAEVWYAEDVGPLYWSNIKNSGAKFRMRMKILAPSFGDNLLPYFDSKGDLIAFGRLYCVKSTDGILEYFDLWTDEDTVTAEKTKDSWNIIKNNTNAIGKIPIVYYKQKQTEWHDVQNAIERLEVLISNFADTNDYFASPMVIAKGEIEGFSKKGEQGKVLKLEGDASVSYLTWNNAPEAVKLEIETLFDIIYTITQTPNMTFKEMKGIGQLSGVAIKLLFLDAKLKATTKQSGAFGEAIQRRINFLKKAMATINIELLNAIDMSIYPIFKDFIPENISEMIDYLIAGTGGKSIVSQETAVKINPLIDNAKEEFSRLQKESNSLGSQF